MFGHSYKNTKKIRLGKGIYCEYVLGKTGAKVVDVSGYGFPRVTIPDVIEGVPVTNIATMAAHCFRSFPNEFQLPVALREIGSGGFSSCIFKEVTLPNLMILLKLIVNY